MADAPFDLDQYTIEALRSAPELTQAPWLAVPVAQQSQQDGNSELNAQAGAHMANMAANAKAQQDLHQHRGNWFTNALAWIGGHVKSVNPSSSSILLEAQKAQKQGATTQQALSQGTFGGQSGMAAAGLPTQEAQHQYRALRDIYDRHGVAAGLAETLGIVAGAAVGSYAGGAVNQPVSGGVLGGEAVAGVSERLLFPDSWQRTADGNAYRDIAGHHVSIGRDIARVVGYGGTVTHTYSLRDGTLPFDVVSGLGDAVADLQADPLARGLGIGHGVGEQLGITGGQMLNGPEAVDNVLNKGTRAQAAFRDIAGKNAGEIIRDYPQFSAVANDLGQASTVDQVGDVFRDALQGPQLRGKWLPYRGVGASASGIAAGTAIADDPIGRVAQFKRVLTEKVPSWLNPETLKFSRSVIDPTAPSALPAMRAELMFGRLSSRLVDGVMSDIAAAQASGQTDLVRIILRNAMEHSALSTGIDADSQSGRILLGKIRGEITDTMGGVSGGDGMHAGYDIEGRDRSFIQNDEGGRAGAALVEGQRGMLTLPTHPDWVSAIREAKGNMALFGRLDDWGYRRLMSPFKQMALMTGGTALRIASAEAIPAVFRNGLLDTIKAGVSAKLGKRAAAEMTPLEQENYVANAVHLLHGPDGVVNEPSLVDDATLLAVKTGDIIPPSLAVDEYVANDAVGKVEADRLNMFKSSQSVPAERVETGRFEGKSQGAQNFPLYWQRAIREFADDEGIQRAAAAYRDAYISAGRERVPMSRADIIDVGSRDAGAAPVAELGPSTAPPSTMPAVTDQAPAVAAPQAEPSLTPRSKAELVRIATRAAEEADHGYLLNDMDPAVRNDMMRNARPATPGQDPLRSWAHERVAVMKGLTHAATLDEAGTVVGEPHLHILDSMANGDTPELQTLADIVPKDRPFMVKGRVTETTAAGNIIDRAASAMWRRVFDPIVGTLGREHQYLLSFHDQMDTFRPMVAEGQLSIDDAVQKAQVNAINDVVRFVHNPYERTQMATLVRNIAPFYFAQEQAYRRVGRLLATDPEAFRRYQMTVSAFSDAVHNVKDAQGQNHFVIPGLGWLDETAINGMATAGLPFASAVPSEVLGNTSSLSTVFPFSEGVRPSFSPFVTLAAHGINALFPEARPYTSAVVGPYTNQPVWSQLVPNAPLRDLITATTSDRSMMSSADWAFRELARQQNVAMGKWLAAGHSRDDPGAPQIVPPPTAAPDVRQKFIERLRNTARINQVFRAIFAAVSPVSPTIDVGKYGIKQEVQDYINKYGFNDGTQRFLAANPNATPYSISSTETVDNAPSIAESRTATGFYLHNRDLFHSYPAAAGYLVPQSANAAYDPAVAQEQIALGLREHKTTTQIVNDFYVNAGYAQFATDYAAHKQAVAQLGSDKRAITGENANWNAYLTGQLAAANPVWWDYFTSKDRENRYARELTQLRQAVTDPRTPQDAQTTGIRGLLADLDEHLNALADGKARHWSEDERQSEVDNWQSYLDQQQAQHPELTVVISRLFKHEGAK